MVNSLLKLHYKRVNVAKTVHNIGKERILVRHPIAKIN